MRNAKCEMVAAASPQFYKIGAKRRTTPSEPLEPLEPAPPHSSPIKGQHIPGANLKPVNPL